MIIRLLKCANIIFLEKVSNKILLTTCH